MQRLCARIADGTYRPLSTTPPLAILATELGVSTQAMVDAVHQLKQAGIITAYRRGKALIAVDALSQIEQRADPLRRAPKTGQGQRVDALAARMRHDISVGAWPERQTLTRCDLCDRYQAPEHLVAKAVKALKAEQLLVVRHGIGAWPLPAAGQGQTRWSFDPAVTLAVGVQEAIKSRITDPSFPPGETLDSEALAEEYGVSYSTVMAALGHLREQRLIEGRGKKTRVVDRAGGTS